jgi:predicted nuclease of predicted toxin-antitoxin system
MKIKLDENLPFQLVTLLKNLGHEARTVHEERLVAIRTGRFGKRHRRNPVS